MTTKDWLNFVKGFLIIIAIMIFLTIIIINPIIYNSEVKPPICFYFEDVKGYTDFSAKGDYVYFSFPDETFLAIRMSQRKEFPCGLTANIQERK